MLLSVYAIHPLPCIYLFVLLSIIYPVYNCLSCCYQYALSILHPVFSGLICYYQFTLLILYPAVNLHRVPCRDWCPTPWGQQRICLRPQGNGFYGTLHVKAIWVSLQTIKFQIRDGKAGYFRGRQRLRPRKIPSLVITDIWQKFHLFN